MQSQNNSLFKTILDSAKPRMPMSMSLTPEETKKIGSDVEGLTKSIVTPLIESDAPRNSFEFSKDQFEPLKSALRQKFADNPVKRKQAIDLVKSLATDWQWIIKSSESLKYLETSAQEFAKEVQNNH